jgi:predicted GTPase
VSNYNSCLLEEYRQQLCEEWPRLLMLKKIKQLFEKCFLDDSPKTLNILITGKTGVGKSRLVNALVCENVAKAAE